MWGKGGDKDAALASLVKPYLFLVSAPLLSPFVSNSLASVITTSYHYYYYLRTY